MGKRQSALETLALKRIEMKKALITGITGQDGSYLAEFLLEKGYEVHGIFRRCSTFNTDRIDHLYVDAHEPDARMFLHAGDLSDGTGLRHILEKVQPDEVYNLAAQSHVRVSFDQPEYTADVTAQEHSGCWKPYATITIEATGVSALSGRLERDVRRGKAAAE